MPDVAPRVELVPLTDAEYGDFAERQVAESARQRVNAGEWTAEEAPAKAREGSAGLLADHLRGHGHHFLKGVTPDGTRVGWVWVAPPPAFLQERYALPNLDDVRWLMQITVDEPLRGRGYGRALLEALHRWLANQGARELYLRVYDWNVAARRLYERAGYEVVRQVPTDAHLRKRLGPA